MKINNVSFFYLVHAIGLVLMLKAAATKFESCNDDFAKLELTRTHNNGLKYYGPRSFSFSAGIEKNLGVFELPDGIKICCDGQDCKVVACPSYTLCHRGEREEHGLEATNTSKGIVLRDPSIEKDDFDTPQIVTISINGDLVYENGLTLCSNGKVRIEDKEYKVKAYSPQRLHLSKSKEEICTDGTRIKNHCISEIKDFGYIIARSPTMHKEKRISVIGVRDCELRVTGLIAKKPQGAREQMRETAQRFRGQVKDAAQGLNGQGIWEIEQVTSAIQDLGRQASERMQQVKNQAEGKMQELGKQGEDSFEHARKSMQGLEKQTTSAIQDLEEQAIMIMQVLRDHAKEIVKEGERRGGKKFEQAKEKMRGVEEQVAKAIKELKEQGESTIEQAKRKMQELREQVGQRIKRGKGKLDSILRRQKF